MWRSLNPFSCFIFISHALRQKKTLRNGLFFTFSPKSTFDLVSKETGRTEMLRNPLKGKPVFSDVTHPLSIINRGEEKIVVRKSNLIFWPITPFSILAYDTN